jgi:type I restriction enzyme S subunit
MSLARYEKYRQSGTDWLGNIPEHWSAARVKTIFEIRKRIAGELGHDVLSVTQQGLKIRNTDSNDGQLSMDYSKYQLVEPDDFVMNHMDLLTGYVDVSKFHGVTSPDYRVFSARKKEVSLSFFLYLFQNGYQQRIFYAFGQGASGLGRWRMPTDSFNDFILPVPPLSEQTAIAAFLDHETSKIDALVEEQQRLIELLKEKRQAVIHQAATKGLDLSVPMKDTDFEWISRVPAHWNVLMAKRVASVFVPQRNKPDLNAVGDGLPWITMEDMARPDIWSSLLHVSSEAASIAGSRVLSKDAVIASCVGSFGVSAINRVDVVINQQLQAFLPHRDVVPEFLRLSVLSSAAYFESVATAATIAYVNQDQFGRLPIALPSIEEQQAIVEDATRSAGLIDNLLVEASLAIGLLQERRAALISAAVTGKIDVRGLIEADAPAPDMVAA